MQKNQKNKYNNNFVSYNKIKAFIYYFNAYTIKNWRFIFMLIWPFLIGIVYAAILSAETNHGSNITNDDIISLNNNAIKCFAITDVLSIGLVVAGFVWMNFSTQKTLDISFKRIALAKTSKKDVFIGFYITSLFWNLIVIGSVNILIYIILIAGNHNFIKSNLIGQSDFWINGYYYLLLILILTSICLMLMPITNSQNLPWALYLFWMIIVNVLLQTIPVFIAEDILTDKQLTHYTGSWINVTYKLFISNWAVYSQVLYFIGIASLTGCCIYLSYYIHNKYFSWAR